MGWHGVAKATPRKQDSSFMPLLRIVLYFCNCCIIFIAKEISPEIWIIFSFYDMLESSVFPAHIFLI